MTTVPMRQLLESYEIDAAWQREFYEWMHANPELAMQEHETHARILKELERFDCEAVSYTHLTLPTIYSV